MTSQDRHQATADDLDVLLAALPPEIVAAIHALPDRESLIEVVLDLGRPPEARYPSSEVTLLEREVTDGDIAYVVEHIGSFGDDNLAGIDDLGQPVPVPEAPWFPKDLVAWSVRWVLLHLIEEIARHAGHADIVRETVDGATAYELMAAAEGWPETDWLKPWKPARTPGG